MHKAASRDKYSSTNVPKELDQYIVDPTTKKRYLRGRFLGKVHNLHQRLFKCEFPSNTSKRTFDRKEILTYSYFAVNVLVLQGGFAKCYELTDMETKEILAGKIISKTMLTKPHQKEKVSKEKCRNSVSYFVELAFRPPHFDISLIVKLIIRFI